MLLSNRSVPVADGSSLFESLASSGFMTDSIHLSASALDNPRQSLSESFQLRPANSPTPTTTSPDSAADSPLFL